MGVLESLDTASGLQASSADPLLCDLVEDSTVGACWLDPETGERSVSGLVGRV